MFFPQNWVQKTERDRVLQCIMYMKLMNVHVDKIGSLLLRELVDIGFRKD